MKNIQEFICESFERRFVKNFGVIDTQIYEEKHPSLAVRLRQVYPQKISINDEVYNAKDDNVFDKPVDTILANVEDVKTIEMLYSFEAMDYKPFNNKNYKHGTISFVFDVKTNKITKINGTGNILLSRLLVTDGFIKSFIEYILVDQFPSLGLDVRSIKYDSEEFKNGLFGPLP